nr:skin secretory protein xP2-like [Peromyscus maniculatus bairdii]
MLVPREPGLPRSLARRRRWARGNGGSWVAQPGPAQRVSWPGTRTGSSPALRAAAQGASDGHNKVKAQSKKSAAVREAEKPEPQKPRVHCQPPPAAEGFRLTLKATRIPRAPSLAALGGLRLSHSPASVTPGRKRPGPGGPSGATCRELPLSCPAPWPVRSKEISCPRPANPSPAPLPVTVPELRQGAHGGRLGERSWRLPQGSHSARKPVPELGLRPSVMTVATKFPRGAGFGAGTFATLHRVAFPGACPGPLAHRGPVASSPARIRAGEPSVERQSWHRKPGDGDSPAAGPAGGNAPAGSGETRSLPSAEPRLSAPTRPELAGRQRQETDPELVSLLISSPRDSGVGPELGGCRAG